MPLDALPIAPSPAPADPISFAPEPAAGEFARLLDDGPRREAPERAPTPRPSPKSQLSAKPAAKGPDDKPATATKPAILRPQQSKTLARADAPGSAEAKTVDEPTAEPAGADEAIVAANAVGHQIDVAAVPTIPVPQPVPQVADTGDASLAEGSEPAALLFGDVSTPGSDARPQPDGAAPSRPLAAGAQHAQSTPPAVVLAAVSSDAEFQSVARGSEARGPQPLPASPLEAPPLVVDEAAAGSTPLAMTELSKATPAAANPVPTNPPASQEPAKVAPPPAAPVADALQAARPATAPPVVDAAPPPSAPETVAAAVPPTVTAAVTAASPQPASPPADRSVRTAAKSAGVAPGVSATPMRADLAIKVQELASAPVLQEAAGESVVAMPVEAVAEPAADPGQPPTPGLQPAQAGASTTLTSAMSAAQTATPRATAETSAALAAQIAKRIEGRSSRFDIELDPAGLGRVNVTVEIGPKGQITAAMAFERPQSAAELGSRAAELRSALEKAGFDVAAGGLSFHSGSGGGAGRNPQEGSAWGGAAGGRAFDAAARTADQADATAVWPSQRTAPGGVDIRI